MVISPLSALHTPTVNGATINLSGYYEKRREVSIFVVAPVSIWRSEGLIEKCYMHTVKKDGFHNSSSFLNI